MRVQRQPERALKRQRHAKHGGGYPNNLPRKAYTLWIAKRGDPNKGADLSNTFVQTLSAAIVTLGDEHISNTLKVASRIEVPLCNEVSTSNFKGAMLCITHDDIRSKMEVDVAGRDALQLWGFDFVVEAFFRSKVLKDICCLLNRFLTTSNIVVENL